MGNLFCKIDTDFELEDIYTTVYNSIIEANTKVLQNKLPI